VWVWLWNASLRLNPKKHPGISHPQYQTCPIPPGKWRFNKQ